MSKVICDICGTSYPSHASNCPICGSSREYALENVDADNLQDSADLFASEGGRIINNRKTKEIFDYDEVNNLNQSDDSMDDDYDEDEEYEEESRTNVGLVVVLVILIVLLLLVSGFFFVRYLLPNMKDEPIQTEPFETTQVIETEPVETTEYTNPCTNLSIDGGKMELGKDGKKLLNVRVYPEDTTDTVVFSSADESIAAVSEDGTVTAVAEGQTVITIQCGSQQISCNVTVDYSAGEETVPTGEIPAPVVDSTESTVPSAETQPAETTAENTEATEETTEKKSPEGQELKLKKDDITISSNYTSVQLELEGDVDPAALKWFTMDSTIAIVHGGLVTSTGSGLTRIYGEYNGQQVMCIVRCIF